MVGSIGVHQILIFDPFFPKVKIHRMVSIVISNTLVRVFIYFFSSVFFGFVSLYNSRSRVKILYYQPIHNMMAAPVTLAYILCVYTNSFLPMFVGGDRGPNLLAFTTCVVCDPTTFCPQPGMTYVYVFMPLKSMSANQEKKKLVKFYSQFVMTLW